jgi:hypothetical protein
MRFLSISTLILLFNDSYASIKTCGGSFSINELILNPDVQVTAGDNVTLSLLYTSPVTVEDGTIKTSLTYNFIPMPPKVEPLCDTVQCPLVAGEHDGSSWFTVPTGLLGTVVTRVEWFDTAQELLLCLTTTLKVAMRSIFT